MFIFQKYDYLQIKLQIVISSISYRFHINIYYSCPWCSCRYFSFVASPPRIWRSALFRSSSSRTWRYSAGLTFTSRSVMSLCTVDLEMPNWAAAARTVDLFSMIYTARSQARCSIFVCTYTTPHTLVFHVYVGKRADMRSGKTGNFFDNGK